MKVKESLKQGKHTSKKFFIIEFICIVVIILSVFIMSDRIEKEKPNATDLSQNGAIGTEAGKYVYLQIDGLSDEIAIGPDDEKYYVAINDGVGYIVSLSSVEYDNGTPATPPTAWTAKGKSIGDVEVSNMRVFNTDKLGVSSAGAVITVRGH